MFSFITNVTALGKVGIYPRHPADQRAMLKRHKCKMTRVLLANSDRLVRLDFPTEEDRTMFALTIRLDPLEPLEQFTDEYRTEVLKYESKEPTATREVI